MSRKRILFLIPSLSAGGAERVFSILLRHLDRSQFELHLALLHAHGPLAREIPTDVIVHDLKAIRVRYALPALVKLVWKLRPDALFSTLGHLNLALIAAKPLIPRGIRLLVRETTMASVFLEEGTRHPQIWQWLYRRLYKHADWIVCPSDAVMEDLARFSVPKEKLVRIYNPVDIQRIRKLAGENTTPFVGRGPHLVAAGRLSAEKGIDVLLNAMPAIVEAFPKVCLSVLGEGPMEADLVRLSTQLKLTSHVEFLGFQENPWCYMKYANLVVLPSRFEGLPNVVLEALALGTEVVATDCSGAMRELLDEDFRITLAPTGDPGALAELIIARCIQRAEDSCKGRVPAAMNRFDLPETMRLYTELLLR